MNGTDKKTTGRHQRILRRIARSAMIERGFLPEFSAEVRDELAALKPDAATAGLRDLRGLPWCSIDNDDSRDLDQLTVAESLAGGGAKILIAVADVDHALVDEVAHLVDLEVQVRPGMLDIEVLDDALPLIIGNRLLQIVHHLRPPAVGDERVGHRDGEPPLLRRRSGAFPLSSCHGHGHCEQGNEQDEHEPFHAASLCE